MKKFFINRNKNPANQSTTDQKEANLKPIEESEFFKARPNEEIKKIELKEESNKKKEKPQFFNRKIHKNGQNNNENILLDEIPTKKLHEIKEAIINERDMNFRQNKGGNLNFMRKYEDFERNSTEKKIHRIEPTKNICVVLSELHLSLNNDKEEGLPLIDNFFSNLWNIELIQQELQKPNKLMNQENIDSFLNFSKSFSEIVHFILLHTNKNLKLLNKLPLSDFQDSLEQIKLQINDSDLQIQFSELENVFRDYKNYVKQLKADILKDLGRQCREDDDLPIQNIEFKSSKAIENPITYKYDNIIEVYDLFNRKKNFFPHVIGDRYSSWDQYINNMFYLLKEDFCEGLRNVINFLVNSGPNYLTSPEVTDNAYIYSNGRIIDMKCDNGFFLCLRIRPLLKNSKGINWNNSKRLIYGSLLVITNANFDNFFLLSVQSIVSKIDEINKNGFVDVFVKDVRNESIDLIRFFENVTFNDMIIIESKAYFESYIHFLRSLQEIKVDRIPFEDKIILKQNLNEQKKPTYLGFNDFAVDQKCLSGLTKKISVNFENTDKNNELANHLDDSQFKALQNIIQNEISIIQGPPGTGKSFIGALSIKILLENKDKWRKKGPILILAYTNHALDQFLCHSLSYTDKIIRIGGRCKEEKLENFIFSKLKQKYFKTIKFNRKYSNPCEYRYDSDYLDIQKERDLVLLNIYKGKESSLADSINEKKLELSNDNMALDHFLESFPLIYQKKFKIELSEILIKNGIQMKKELHESSVRILFEIWKENSTVSYILLEKIIENERKYKNENTKQLISRSTLLGSSNVLNIKTNDELDVDESEEDLNFLENKNIENQIEKKPKTYQNLFFFYNSEANNEILQEKNFFSTQNIWDLTSREKNMLFNYAFLKKNYNLHDFHELTHLIKNYNDNLNMIKNINLERELSILRGADIIGMTVTGCAKYSYYLKELHSPITIIEEAAEVLECYNISVFTEHLKHLILIGDHQQLRPHIESYNLERNYNFAISLFERLIINGINYVTLNRQRRMRPYFADFIRIIYENNYFDHESVNTYENIKGIDKNLCFFHHSFPENEENFGSKTKMNEFEAQFVCCLAEYFVKQGYKENQITILALYIGQIFRIRKLIQQKNIKDIQVSTVDNYQGEENDIVLVSLVRSNKSNKVGFAGVMNRICVSLSRAKKGMYVFGNFDCLCSSKQGTLWRKIIDLAKKKSCFVNSLNLSCQNHQKETIISEIKDFEKVPEGGCKMICNNYKECGHICKKFCHNSYEKYHSKTCCDEKCMKYLDCGHQCFKICREKCECTTEVIKTLNCGHSDLVLCPKPIYEVNCKKPCEKYRKCKHKCQGKCFQNCEELFCMENVMVLLPCGHHQNIHCSEPNKKINCKTICGTLLPCGHSCSGTCYDCFQKKIHVPCQKPCEMKCEFGHKCNKLCGEYCGLCNEKCGRVCLCGKTKCSKYCCEECDVCPNNCSCINEQKISSFKKLFK